MDLEPGFDQIKKMELYERLLHTSEQTTLNKEG